MVDVESAGGLHARGSPSRARQARVSIGSVAPRARAPRSLPKVALGPVAVVVLLGLAWSANGGGAARERGAKRAVVNRLATRFRGDRAREDVPVDDVGTPVAVAAPSPRYDHSVWTPGRFVRSNGPPISRARGPPSLVVARARPSHDGTHPPDGRRFPPPSLPPLPPASPRAPPRPPQSPTTPTLFASRSSSRRPPPVPSGSSPVPAKKPLASARTLASTPRPFPSRARRRARSDVSATDDAFAHRDTPRPARRRRHPGRSCAFYLPRSRSRAEATSSLSSVREYFPFAPLCAPPTTGGTARRCAERTCATLPSTAPPLTWIPFVSVVALYAPRFRGGALARRVARAARRRRARGRAHRRWPTTDAGGVEDHKVDRAHVRGSVDLDERRLPQSTTPVAPAYALRGLCGGVRRLRRRRVRGPAGREGGGRGDARVGRPRGKMERRHAGGVVDAPGKSVAPWGI